MKSYHIVLAADDIPEQEIDVDVEQFDKDVQYDTAFWHSPGTHTIPRTPNHSRLLNTARKSCIEDTFAVNTSALYNDYPTLLKAIQYGESDLLGRELRLYQNVQTLRQQQ